MYFQGFSSYLDLTSSPKRINIWNEKKSKILGGHEIISKIFFGGGARKIFKFSVPKAIHSNPPDIAGRVSGWALNVSRLPVTTKNLPVKTQSLPKMIEKLPMTKYLLK